MKTLRAAGVFLAYLALFAAVFRPVVFGAMTFVRRDIQLYYYPMWKFAKECLDSGVFPFWNPFPSFGVPFFANPQTCVLSPVALAVFRMPDFTRAFNVYVVVHFALASSFAYLWMRGYRASRPAAALTGLAYGLTGYMMSAINLTIALCSAAYFPLCLYAFRRATLDPRFFWKGIAAGALVLEYLAGDPAVLFATFFVFTLVVAFEALAGALARDWRRAWGPAWTLAQVTATFLGLAAFHMFSFVEFLSHSMRRFLAPGEAALWSMQFNDVVGSLVPYVTDMNLYVMDYWVRQSWLENYYIGMTVAVLAAVAAARRDDVAARHVLLALAGLVLALGQFMGPLYGALYEYYPFFRFVRYPVRFFFIFSFGAACLAGFGLDRVLSRGRLLPSGAGGAALRRGCFAAVAAAACLVLLYRPVEAAVSDWAVASFGEATKPFYPAEVLRDLATSQLANFRRAAVFFLMAVAAVAATRRWRIPARAAGAALVALVAADLLSANLSEPFIKKHLWGRLSENMEVIAKEPGIFRVMSSPKMIHSKEWRVMKRLEIGLIDQKDSLASNLVMLHGFYDGSGYDSIYIEDVFRVQGIFSQLKSADSRLVDALNLRFIVSPGKSIGPNFEAVHSREPFNLFRNARALPRAFMAARASAPGGRDEVLARLKGDFDPEAEIFLDAAVPEPAAKGSGAGRVEIVDYGPNRVRMKATAGERPWLFFSDTYFPGWKAEVDGRPSPVYRANYAFRALLLEPGEHDVVWSYEPTFFRAGLAVTAATAFLLAAYYAGAGKFLKRPSPLV